MGKQISVKFGKVVKEMTVKQNMLYSALLESGKEKKFGDIISISKLLTKYCNIDKDGKSKKIKQIALNKFVTITDIQIALDNLYTMNTVIVPVIETSLSRDCKDITKVTLKYEDRENVCFKKESKITKKIVTAESIAKMVKSLVLSNGLDNSEVLSAIVDSLGYDFADATNATNAEEKNTNVA